MLDLGILNGMQPLQCKLSVRSLPMIRHQKRFKFWSFENDDNSRVSREDFSVLVLTHLSCIYRILINLAVVNLDVMLR
jgi:hypothetical protein